MEYLALWFLLTALIGWWADQWGRDWLTWGAISLFLSPLIAGIALLVTGENKEETAHMSGLKKCSYCAEFIKAEAIKCKHCGADIINTKGAEYLEEKQLNELIEKLQKGK